MLDRATIKKAPPIAQLALDSICMSVSLGSKISIQKQPSFSRSENTSGPSDCTVPVKAAWVTMCGKVGAWIKPVDFVKNVYLDCSAKGG